MNRVCIAAGSLILLAAAAFTPLRAAEPLSLAQAERGALSANPKLRAARLEALAAQKRASQSVGRHFGELSFVGQYDHFERNRILVPMAVELFANPSLGMSQLPWDRNQVHYGLQWQIPLLASGRLHEGDRIARLSRSAAQHMALFTRAEIRYNVRAAYRNALIVQHALEASTAYRLALQKDEADAQLRVKLGTWAPVAAAKVTYALRGAEAQETDFTAQSRTAQAALAALMGRTLPQGGFTLQDIPQAPAKETGRPEDAAHQALSGRDDLLASRDATQVFLHKKRLAMEAFSPELVLQGTYLRNEAPSVQDSIDTRQWALMIRIPLFSGLTRVYAVQEANANLLAAKQREKAKELEVSTQVVNAEGRLEAARALYQAGQAQRRLGHEVANVEHLKLEQGTGKMEDYLAARGEELAGETAYWRGLYTYQSAADYLTFVTARGGTDE